MISHNNLWYFLFIFQKCVDFGSAIFYINIARRYE
jgi:hypothetical protein